MRQPTDKLLTLIGHSMNLNALTGKDRDDVLAFGRAVWAAARVAGFSDAMQEARDRPRNTCGASRHAQQIAESLMAGNPIQGGPDSVHAGESIAAMVTALWHVRTEHKEQAEAIRVLWAQLKEGKKP